MTPPRFKASILRCFFWLLLVAIVTSCAPANPASPTSLPATNPPATNPPATSAPAEPVVYRSQVPIFEMDWSPLRGGGFTNRHKGWWWAAPMYFDTEGELHPMIFESWSSNADATEWTFTIDPRAVWSDGTPITADEIVGSWNLMTRPGTRHQRIALIFAGVEGFDEVQSGSALDMSGLAAPAPNIVVVTLTAPDPILHFKVASHLVAPVKPSQAAGPDGQEVQEWWRPENGVITSGPFVPVSMDLDGGMVVMERNPHFWLGTPKIDRLEFISIEDANLVTTMMQNGEIDEGRPGGPDVAALLGEEFLHTVPIPGASWFWFNPMVEPTNDLLVRQALVMAVNRDELMAASYPLGQQEKAGQLLQGLPGEDPNYEDYPYDPEAAQAALAESSYGSAANLPKLFIVGVNTPDAELAAQYIAEQWRQVLGIEAVEFIPQYDDYTGPDKDRVQIWRDQVGVRIPDAPSLVFSAIHSSSQNAQVKLGGYSNPEIDALIEAAISTQVDDPERLRLAQEAARKFHELWLGIPWSRNANAQEVMPWVKNWRRNIDSQVVEPWNVYIER